MVWGELFEVDFNGKVVALLHLDDHAFIFSLKNIFDSVFEQIAVAFDGHGKVNDRLDGSLIRSQRIRQVESDIVKVGDDLVNACRTRRAELFCEDGLDEQIVRFKEQHRVSSRVPLP